MTETEIERLVVRLVGDGSSYQKMLKDAEQQSAAAAVKVETAAKKIEGIAQAVESFGKKALGFLSSLGIAAGLQHAFQKFEDAERGAVRLSAAIEGNNGIVGKTVERYKAFAGEISKITLLSKGTTFGLLAQAEAMGFTGDKAEKVVKLAIALGKGNKEEAEGFLRVATMIERGHVEFAARALGLRGITDKTELMNAVNRRAAVGMKVAAAEMNTVSGRVEMMERQMAGLSKEVGGLVAEGVIPLVTKLQSVAEQFNSLEPATRRWIVQAVAATSALTLFAGTLPKVIAGLAAIRAGVIAFATSPVTAWVAVIAAAAVGIYQLNRAVYEARAEVQEFNRSLEGTGQLTGKSLEYADKRMKAVTEAAEKMVNRKEKESLLGDAVKAAEKEIKGLEESLKNAEKNLDAADTTWNTVFQPSIIKQSQSELDDFTRRLAAAKDRAAGLKQEFDKVTDAAEIKKLGEDVDKFTAEMQKAADAAGLDAEQQKLREFAIRGATEAQLDAARAAIDTKKTIDDEKKLTDEIDEMVKTLKEEVEANHLSGESAKLRKFEMRGASEEQLEQARSLAATVDEMKEVNKISEEFKDPQQAYSERMAKLNDLLSHGAITQQEFARASDAAAKKLKEAEKAANKAADAVNRFDHAAYGGAEAASRISAQRDLLSRGVGQSFANTRPPVDYDARSWREAATRATATVVGDKNDDDHRRWKELASKPPAGSWQESAKKAGDVIRNQPLESGGSVPELLRNIRDDIREGNRAPEIKVESAGLV